MEEISVGFKPKGMTSILLFLTLIIDTISGIILYIAPFGRFANWTGWTFLGLTKPEWGAIHTIFSYLFLIIACFHLYYNWKAIVHFIWCKVRGSMSLKPEFIAALMVVLFIFVGTLANIQPFRTVMDFGKKTKLSWERDAVESPVRPYSKPFRRFKRWRGNRGAIFEIDHSVDVDLQRPLDNDCIIATSCSRAIP